MKAKHWKKIIFIVCIIGLLGFTFWYGGDAPGLQGFPDAENEIEETVADTEQTAEQGNQAEQNSQTTEKTETTEENVFQEIVMHITKKESTSDTTNEKTQSTKKASYKQVQTNKKAQKNADKAVEKASKKKKTTKSKKKNTESKKKTESKKDETSTEKKNSDKIQCTIFISCATILDNMDRVPTAKQKIIPSDGIILKEVKISVKKGSTVFDVLQTATKENKIHLEYTYTPLYKNYYIEGIYNLYEFECGNGSGWLYSVNDEFPSEGCSTYEVENGDVIKWLYTCDFGEDVGKYYQD